MKQPISPSCQTQDLKYGRKASHPILALLTRTSHRHTRSSNNLTNLILISFSHTRTLPMDFLFENCTIQSAEPGNTINLELSLQPLHHALKSAQNSLSASLRLTKKKGVPVLSMTITTTTSRPSHANAHAPPRPSSHDDPFGFVDDDNDRTHLETSLRREHEKIITQDIPIRVLHPDTVASTVQPVLQEPDVHIQLPPLVQLKAISDRFTKLALAAGSSSKSPRLEISASMHGGLRVRITTETADISSAWTDLDNPELDPAQLRVPIEEHPSTKFRDRGPDAWASVYVDGKDWSRVLSAGRLEGRVIACFCHNHSLVLYVYIPHYDDAGGDDAVLTVSPKPLPLLLCCFLSGQLLTRP